MNNEYPKSPYEKTGGIVHFARMLDKIRLHEAGKLPQDYHDYLGMPAGFDGRCCSFLQVDYKQVTEQVKRGKSDEEVLAWCFENGHKPSDIEITVWNAFMTKRGWRDEGSSRLKERLQGSGLDKHIPSIETFFDFIEVDEKRIPPSFT